MKNKVFNTVIFLLLFISITSCESNYDYKYTIYDNRGIVYYCNFYNKNEDGCILFNNMPGVNNEPGTPTILCGNFTIEENKQ